MNTSVQQDVRDVVERARNGVDKGQQYAHQTVDRVAEKAATLAHDGADWVRERSDRVRGAVVRGSDRAVDYVRHEPVRSVLMALAAGAALVLLARWVGQRPRSGFDRSGR